ncbi:hypothetical protein FHS90_003297 [Rufibacter quisquiliarum]|uniref:Uncharacterized protein n=1 Tax=Rufibacter quisquiliarum TaxID=1549639 RepID=A0A839GUK6_9BACT|nr:hypothetical protein [Rufibacter quisquiliarum]
MLLKKLQKNLLLPGFACKLIYKKGLMGCLQTNTSPE